MHVLVVGAGIIGSIYGWALAESGHHVAHLVRSGRAAAFRDGLPLDVFDRRKGHKRNIRGLYRPDAVETLSPDRRLRIGHRAGEALCVGANPQGSRSPSGAAEFLLLTQNWRGTSDIDPILPRTRYVYGDAKAGGTFSEGTLVAALKAIDFRLAGRRTFGTHKKSRALFPRPSATLLFPLHRFAFCARHHEGAIVGRIAFLREGLLDGQLLIIRDHVARED